MNFFETFPECSLPRTVSKNNIKMIGQHSRLRDMMGHIYGWANLTPFMPVLVLITRVVHQSTLHLAVGRNLLYKSTTREKNLTGRKCRAYGTM